MSEKDCYERQGSLKHQLAKIVEQCHFARVGLHKDPEYVIKNELLLILTAVLECDKVMLDYDKE